MQVCRQKNPLLFLFLIKKRPMQAQWSPIYKEQIISRKMTSANTSKKQPKETTNVVYQLLLYRMKKLRARPWALQENKWVALTALFSTIVSKEKLQLHQSSYVCYLQNLQSIISGMKTWPCTCSYQRKPKHITTVVNLQKEVWRINI